MALHSWIKQIFGARPRTCVAKARRSQRSAQRSAQRSPRVRLAVEALETRVCPALPGNDWMAYVPDGTSLYQMSLPGTHDTMTYSPITDEGSNFWYSAVVPQINSEIPDWLETDVYNTTNALSFGQAPLDLRTWLDNQAYTVFQAAGGAKIVEAGVQTQTMTLEQQLNAGIRVLDIRLQEIGNTLEDVHGSEKLGLTFVPDVLQVVTDFLAANPSETVVMEVQVDAPGGNNTESFDQVFHDDEALINPDINQPYGNYIWQATTSPVPTDLGQARGKIVILQSQWNMADNGDSVTQVSDPNFADEGSLLNTLNPNSYQTQDVLGVKWPDAVENFNLAATTLPPPNQPTQFVDNGLSVSDPGVAVNSSTPGQVVLSLAGFPEGAATGDGLDLTINYPTSVSDFLDNFLTGDTPVLQMHTTSGGPSMNNLAYTYLTQGSEAPLTPTGIVAMDFAPDNLIQEIYDRNDSAPTCVVNSLSDSSSADGLTLREAVEIEDGQLNWYDLTPAQRAQVFPGSPTEPTPVITFAPSLSGGTIDLTATLELSDNLTIDATALPGGLTVAGNGTFGIFQVDPAVAAVFSGLTITGGAAYSGGGINVGSGGHLTLDESTVTGNSASFAGGGIALLSGGFLNMVDSTVANNSAPQGGGLVLEGDSASSLQAVMNDSTVADNSDTIGGSGIQIGAAGVGATGTLDLYACTIAANTGGLAGILTYENPDSNGRGLGRTVIQCVDTLVADNGDKNFDTSAGGVIVSLGNNLSSDGTGTLDGPGDLTNTNPLLAPLGYYGGPTETMPLMTGSPAIAAGAASNHIPTIDQRGFPRPASAWDIGAFQTEPASDSYVVDTTADPAGTLGEQSLRGAIDLANALGSGPTITFDRTVFATAQTISLSSGTLELSNRMAIDATLLPDGITLAGNGKGSVFQVDNGVAAEFKGLTITGGSNASGGGGINAGTGANLVLSDCTLTGNTSGTAGGGLAMNDGGRLTMTDCTVANNSAAEGGGIFLQGISAAVSATLTDCTVADNSATNGSSGSGIEIGASGADASLLLQSCTVADNTGGAAGILSFINSGTTLVQYIDTLVADNAGANFSNSDGGTLQSLGHNLSSDGTGNLTAAGDLGDTNPLLAPLDYYDGPTESMALLPGSPAIAAGAPGTGLPQSDQNGFLRSINAWDIGAFESRDITDRVTTAADPGQPGQFSLRGAIDLANAFGDDPTITFSDLGAAPTILLTAGTLELSHNITIDATALPGGLTITGSDSSGASEVQNGIFQVDNGVTATLKGLTITGGTASWGGGINTGIAVNLTLDDCTITGNTATTFGGGLALLGGILSMNDCTVADNTAQQGGGLVMQGATGYAVNAILTNCTIADNTNSIGASAIQCGASGNDATASLLLTACTIADNTGGVCGIVSYNDNNNDGSNASIAYIDTIVADNSGVNFYSNGGTLTSLGFNLSSDGTGNLNGNGDLSNADPQLTPLGNYGGPTETMALVPGSPAIGAGASGDGIPTTDQRGLPRPAYAVDIGAFQTTPLVVNTTADPGEHFGQLSLRQAINLSNALGSVQPITFDPTVFSTPQTIDLTSTLELSKDVTIDATRLPNLVTIAGNGTFGIFQLDDGISATLAGLAITGGAASSGGGINVGAKANLTLNECSVMGNSASFAGGGIALLDGGGLNMNDSTLADNSGYQGGGLMLQAVNGNYVTAVLNDCTVADNSASGGGSAIESGADGANNNANLELTACTIADNTGGLAGITSYELDGAQNASSIQYLDTIVADNGGANFDASAGGTILSAGYSLVSDMSGDYGVDTDFDGVEPHLAPLGYYGGPTETMALTPASSAVVGTGYSSGYNFDGTPEQVPGTDQRGFTRPSDPDIGAYQSEPASVAYVVTTTADPGQFGRQSLRGAIDVANVAGGDATITFNPGLFAAPQTIALTGGSLEITAAATINATSLPSGVSVAGNGTGTVFQVDSGATAVLKGLTITGGSNASGGGGINAGTDANLVLSDCTLTGNTSGTAGGGLAMSDGGRLAMTDCTVANNSAAEGGGIFLQGMTAGLNATMTDCTVADNSATNSSSGSGIEIGASGEDTQLLLQSCTVADNTGGAAGILSFDNTRAALVQYIDTLVADNAGANFSNSDGGTLKSLGHNLSSDGTGNLTATRDLGDTNPLLAPLGNYGGLTETMALLPGSPAIDAGVASDGIPGTDQRGESRVNAPDIGAFESQGFKLSYLSGDNQTVVVGQSFASLRAKLTANNPVEPIAGGVVTFTVNGNQGAGADLGTNPVVLGASGSISMPATADDVGGSYTVTAAASGAAASISYHLTNEQWTPTVSITDAGGIYDGAPYAVSSASVTSRGVNVSGFGTFSYAYYSGTFNEASQLAGQTPLPAAPTNVGNYTVIASWGSNNIAYTSASSAPVTFTITPEALTIDAVSDSKTYDGSTTDRATPSVVGTVYNGEVAYTQAFESKDVLGAGLSTLVVSYTVSPTASGDYTITTNTASGTITPATLAIDAVSDSKTYDGTTNSSKTPTFQVAGEPVNTLYGSDTLTGVSQSFAAKDVPASGSNTMVVNSGYTVNDGNGGADYTVTTQTASGTITPEALTIDAVSNSKTYDGTTTSTQTPIVAAGTVYNNEVTYAQAFQSPDVVRGGNTLVVSYTVSPAASTDYTIATNTAAGTINPATPTVAVTDAGGTYDGSPFAATATVTGIGGTGSSLQGVSPTLTYYSGTSATGTPLSGAPSAAGTYTVVASFPGSTDYTSAGAQTPFTIAKDGTSTAVSDTVSGQFVTLSATIAAAPPFSTTPTGTVDFYDATTGVDLTPAGVALVNGTATFTAALTLLGSQQITATYSGDGNFLTSSTAVTAAPVASLYVLSSSAQGALTLSGNASISVPGVVDVDSKATHAITASGTAVVTAGSINVTGGVLTSGSAKVSPKPTTGAKAVADPFASLPVPSVSGASRGAINVAGNTKLTINPGIYTSIAVSGNGKLTMNPGIYVIAGGGLTVSGNGSVTGAGVVIYNAGNDYLIKHGTSFGAITLSGNASITLSAPTTGPYAGVAIFQARDNSRAMTLSGNNAASSINGGIYAPAAALTLSGNAQLTDSVIVATIDFVGTPVNNGRRWGDV